MIIQNPLWIEKFGKNEKMFFDQCSSNSDCMVGDCGRLKRGDDDKVCCGGDAGLYGGLDYCEGTAKIGELCWFDHQCEDHGYCETTCKKAKEIGESCDNDDECRSDWCTASWPNPKKCKAKFVVGDKCSRDNQCETDYCERMIIDDADSYECCANSSVLVDAKDYCAKTRDDGEVCVHNNHCKSGYCNGE